MKTKMALATAAGTLLALTTAASATVTVTQSASAAPTYGTTLNFDEPGTPTGLVPSNTWSSLGIDITDGVNGPNTVVDDFTNVFPWVGQGNSTGGNFGLFMTFSQGISDFSCQLWDPSGPPSPFGGGGMFIYVNDEFAGAFTPAWGGIGDTWFNIVASGETISSIVIFNGSFIGDATFMDNMSWNNVPAPGSIALLALGFAARGRRRA